MGTINSSDIIFATLTQQGRQVASFRFSGMTTFTDIIRRVRSAVAGSRGIVTLSLRNSSQGWSHDRRLILAPSTTPVQMSLF